MNPLITALQQADLYPHPVYGFELIETHISWVLLTGIYAYKLKKPVNFGFLDFSTLELRRHYCQKELRLNKRLAGEYYIEVVAITGTPEHPTLNGSSPVIDYAVKMRQFPQAAQFDRLLAKNLLNTKHIKLLSSTVANFHQHIASATPDTSFGRPQTIKAAVDENLKIVKPLATATGHAELLEDIEQWCESEYQKLQPEFQHRKQQGFVRECHGDMHLRNMALVNDEVLIFDCIEFNSEFRWIDVMSEVAFVVMDLDDRAQPGFSTQFLNEYLEICGDYHGLTLLPYYLVYRAMVRAKVDCLRLAQTDITASEQEDIRTDFQRYLQLAGQYTKVHDNFLVITHGLSGSGKTWHTTQLMQVTRFIRLRSDVERKRMFTLTAEQNSHSATDAGIYSAQASDMTYQQLAQISRLLLASHWTVVVDATFLQREKRKQFFELAQELGKPFLILNFLASTTTLRDRIHSRQSLRDASEATIEVLERQLTRLQELSEGEQLHTLNINTEAPIKPEQLWASICNKLKSH